MEKEMENMKEAYDQFVQQADNFIAKMKDHDQAAKDDADWEREERQERLEADYLGRLAR